MCVRLLGHPKTFPEGKVPTESADEGMRREMGIGEPTKTARFVTFFLFRQHKCCHLPHGGRSCQAILDLNQNHDMLIQSQNTFAPPQLPK